MTNVEESKNKDDLSENVLVITIDQNTNKVAHTDNNLVNDVATNDQSIEHLSPGKTVSSSSTSSTSSIANQNSEAAPASSNDANAASETSASGAASNAATDNDQETEEYVESDDHLPRVQEELDTLNYANEAINNLELELEECKREHSTLVEESSEKLKVLEKKLGSCVAKCRQYYELKPEVEDLKAKYLKAKHRFETAQELYVAAKNMQMYAEENLENFELKLNDLNETPENGLDESQANISQVNTTSNDISNISYASSSLGKRRTQHLNDGNGREMLTNILEDAKKKVIETESSKQINDQLQIDSYMVYSQKLKILEQMEKDLRRAIEKSREYYELKAEFDKEINFSSAKLEGLKSCLKEAKLTYHQALKNLERISTEIHTQRQTMNISNAVPSSTSNATTPISTEPNSAVEPDDKKSSSYDTSNSSSSLIYQNGDSSLNNRLFSMNDSFSEFAEAMSNLDVKGSKGAASFENSKLTLFNNKSSNSDLDMTPNDSEEAEPEDFDQYFKSAAAVKSPTNSLFTNLDSKSPLETSGDSSPSNTKESSPVTSSKEQPAPVSCRPQFRLPALLLRSPAK